MTPSIVIVVDAGATAGEARRLASDLAASAGFGETATGRVALVATEAATNLAKHAPGGEVLLRLMGEHRSGAVTLLAIDAGAGVADTARALEDGTSTAGSPGTGLGAMRRLSALFDIYSSPRGTVVLAAITDASVAPPTPTDVGVVSVALRGEEQCGDDWAVVEEPERTVAMVADGLGHGTAAHEAARAATRLFREHADRPLAEVLERVHDGLRTTRGAAAAIVELDRERRLARFAGVGNVAGTVCEGERARNMVSHHGILGHQVRKVQEFTYPWPPEALVVLHSDGLSARWDLRAYPGLSARHPMLIAGVLYRDFRRKTDDATIVVLREAG